MSRGKAFLLTCATAAFALELPFCTVFELDVLPLYGLMYLVAISLTAVIAYFPCTLALHLAQGMGARQPVGRVLIYLSSALMTALLATTVGAFLMTTDNVPGDPEVLTFGEALARYLTWTLPAALVGGGTFSLLNRIHYGE